MLLCAGQPAKHATLNPWPGDNRLPVRFFHIKTLQPEFLLASRRVPSRKTSALSISYAMCATSSRLQQDGNRTELWFLLILTLHLPP